MEINNKEVGVKIKSIRQELGKTTKEFGSLIDGASDSLVSRWERGVNLPNSKRLKLIADIGNISVNELLYGSIENYIRAYIISEINSDDWKEAFELNIEDKDEVIESTLQEAVKRDGVRKFYEAGDFRAVNLFLYNELVAAILRTVNQIQYTNRGVYHYSESGLGDILEGLKKYREYGASIGLCDDIEVIVSEAHGKITNLYEKYEDILK